MTADRFVVLFCALAAAFVFGLEYGKQTRPACQDYEGYRLSSQVDWADNRECIYRPEHGAGMLRRQA